MDERLVKAARAGDVNSLNKLIDADPEILKRASSSAPFADSPLHIAALNGKSDFVEKIVSRPVMPSLAIETNEQGRIPLHLASSQGHVETVKALLEAKLDDEDGPVDQCLMKDDQGWIPLHCASQKGKIMVIKVLIKACPQSLEQVTAKGETVLHIALKANQFDAVQMLADSIRLHNFHKMLKEQDAKGKTAYQLAAAKKLQPQILEALKEDEDDDEISEELYINMEGNEIEASNKEDHHQDMSNNEGQLQQEDAILVVATLIITLTYQTMASPPTTFFKDGMSTIDWDCLELKPPFMVNRLKECPANLALWFMLFNTLIFFTSIFVVLPTLRGPRIYVLQLLIVDLVYCYCVLLTAFCYNSVYFAFPFGTLVIVGFTLSRRNEAFGPLISFFGTLASKWCQKNGYHKVPTSSSAT